MNIVLKTISFVVLSGLLMTTIPAHADYENWLQNQKNALKPSLATFVGLPVILGVVYTFFKTPQETVDHEKNFINFIDDVVCGNREVENGTIQEGNRVKPYVIPARGLIGNMMKYSLPFATACATVGACYLAHAACKGLTLRGLEELILYSQK